MLCLGHRPNILVFFPNLLHLAPAESVYFLLVRKPGRSIRQEEPGEDKAVLEAGDRMWRWFFWLFCRHRARLRGALRRTGAGCPLSIQGTQLGAGGHEGKGPGTSQADA